MPRSAKRRSPARSKRSLVTVASRAIGGEGYRAGASCAGEEAAGGPATGGGIETRSSRGQNAPRRRQHGGEQRRRPGGAPSKGGIREAIPVDRGRLRGGAGDGLDRGWGRGAERRIGGRRRPHR